MNETLQKRKPEVIIPIKYLLSLASVALLITLPFHILIGSKANSWKIFPKENLTFNHTFVTDSEISQLSEKYHDASSKEQLEMNVDPFIRKLIQEDALYKVEDYTNDDGSTGRVILVK